MNVWQTYRSLTPEQRRILEQKQVELRRPVDEILALLKPLAACDGLADRARTPLGCTMALGVLAIIGVVIWMFNAGVSAVTVIPVVALVIFVFLTGKLFGWTRRVDLSNNLREFVLPVLAIFRDDFDRGRPVHVRLDLRSPTDDAKLRQESEPYAAGAYYKVVDKFYNDDWMTADAILNDGTRLRWSISESLRVRSKTKKNPRGKHKTKTKSMKKSTIEVEVGLRKKTYVLNAAPAEGEVSDGDKRETVKIVRHFRYDNIDPLVPRVLVDAVTGVYRNVARVKKEA